MTAGTRLVIIGSGAIAGRFAELVAELDELAGASIVGVIVRRDRARSPLGPAIRDIAALRAARPDIVVEAAGVDAVREWGEVALGIARTCVISSTAALCEDGFRRRLERVARSNGSRLVLSTGAIGGVDALTAMAMIGGLRVTHRIRKPPHAWGRTEVDASTVLFRGSAREAALAYPRNANVAALTALTGAGLDRTMVELVADPGITRNHHEILASGPLGSIRIEIDGRALEGNPRSSELAALALARIVRAEQPGITA